MNRVICYRNLRRGDWTLAAATASGGRGKVLEHRAELVLADVTFIVRETGRQRVLRQHCREVHAWALGTLVADQPAGQPVEITYNPYRAGHFATRAGERIEYCAAVHFTRDHGAIGIF